MTAERRRLQPFGVLLAAALAASVIAGTVNAGASWLTDGGGDGGSVAGSVAAPAAPTVELIGADVVLDWVAIPDAPTPLYVVRRYEDGGAEATIGAGCDIDTVFLTCTEAAVPSGTWRYTVTAKVGAWTGDESPPSDPVVVP